MTLSAGTRLGPYEISDSIGSGGMGQVYRARDTRLDRTVAVKVLPGELASAPEFRERFEREARTIAALNHPHICTLFDVGHQDGTDYLVLEYLQGETLADRLARGALSIEQALELGIQIADALARAHRVGIVHRDLKPGNVMLTSAGAKLLDFGLAKAAATSGPTSASILPTTPPNLTAKGTLLGTSHYMAPEQVQGDEADARTDIFAFGVVMYEMLTGQRPFTGRSLAHLHAAILEHEPEPLAVRLPSASPALVRSISKCLAKDPDGRWQNAADLRDELRWVASQDTGESLDGARPSGLRASRVPWLVAGVLAVTSIGFAIIAARRPAPSSPEYQVELTLPAPLSNSVFNRFALAPNGRSLAFTAPNQQGNIVLWVRDLTSGEVRALAGTEGANGPFWSPDSLSIGFAVTDTLKRVDASGGPVSLLHRLGESGQSFGRATWNRDGIVVFAPSASSSALFQIDVQAPDTQRSAVTRIDTKVGELGHFFPTFLPDGRRFLFVTGGAEGPLAAYFGSLDSEERIKLLDDVNDVQYASGYLLFVRGTTLLAQRFDPSTGVLSGQTVPLTTQVLVGNAPMTGAAFSVSPTGNLVYQTGTDSTTSRLTWMNRQGAVTSVVAGAADHADLFMSNDGRFASVSRPESGAGSTRDIWTIDTATGRPRKLTVDPGNEFEGTWSFSGDRVLYNSSRKGVLDLYARSANGAGTEQEIYTDSVDKYPQSWSPDGEHLLYMTFGDTTGQDLWLLPLRTRKPEPLLRGETNEGGGQFSPDGQWITYWARGHVWIMPFRRPGGPWQVSAEGGGVFPRWTRNGKEILYLSGPWIMSTTVNCAGETCEVEPPQRLFQRRYNGPARWSFAVAPDGQRILALTTEGQATSEPLTLLVNWPARVSAAN